MINHLLWASFGVLGTLALTVAGNLLTPAVARGLVRIRRPKQAPRPTPTLDIARLEMQLALQMLAMLLQHVGLIGLAVMLLVTDGTAGLHAAAWGIGLTAVAGSLVNGYLVAFRLGRLVRL